MSRCLLVNRLGKWRSFIQSVNIEKTWKIWLDIIILKNWYRKYWPRFRGLKREISQYKLCSRPIIINMWLSQWKIILVPLYLFGSLCIYFYLARFFFGPNILIVDNLKLSENFCQKFVDLKPLQETSNRKF